MNTETPAVSVSKQLSASPKKTFQDMVKGELFRAELANALPKHLTVDRFTRVLLTATLRTPKLLECTQESLFKAIFDAAAAGLEIDGRRAHAIPYRNNQKGVYECQLIIDYKGLVELAMRSGLVSSIHADVVCEDDVFEVDRGLIVSHKINYKQPRARPYAAYCIIRFRDGGEPKCEVLTKDQIYSVRARSKAANAGPWVTDELEMWKKTAARRALKWVPLSPEIREAVEREDVEPPTINVTPPPLRGLSEMLDTPKPPKDEPIKEEPPEPDADDPGSVYPPETSPAPGPESFETAKPVKPVGKLTVKKAEPKAEPKAVDPLPERTSILTEIEGFMLSHGIPEARVMIWARAQNVEAAELCQEVRNLPTAMLVELKAALPNFK